MPVSQVSIKTDLCHTSLLQTCPDFGCSNRQSKASASVIVMVKQASITILHELTGLNDDLSLAMNDSRSRGARGRAQPRVFTDRRSPTPTENSAPDFSTI